MTEQVTIQTENQTAVQVAKPTINLPMLSNPEEAKRTIQENLDGLGDMKFDKINMPSGGGISFTIVDENNKKVPLAEISGVLLHKKPFKAWYLKSFDEKDEDDIGIPDCFSEDNIHGSGCEEAGIPEGQLCKTCPHNQWSSDRRGGRGKDCAEKIRIHVLMEENAFPKFIDLPPTSTGNFKDYVKRLANKLNPFYGVVTTIGLESDKSGKGIAYSKTTFAKAASMSNEEKVAIRQYIGTIAPIMERISPESIALDEADVVDTGNIGGGSDSDQPY